MDHDIPPRRHIDDLEPIRTQADLERYWRMIMGPLGFGERLIWMQVLDRDGRVTPVLTQIAELPLMPAAADEDGLTSSSSISSTAGCPWRSSSPDQDGEASPHPIALGPP